MTEKVQFCLVDVLEIGTRGTLCSVEQRELGPGDTEVGRAAELSQVD